MCTSGATDVVTPVVAGALDDEEPPQPAARQAERPTRSAAPARSIDRDRTPERRGPCGRFEVSRCLLRRAGLSSQPKKGPPGSGGQSVRVRDHVHPHSWHNGSSPKPCGGLHGPHVGRHQGWSRSRLGALPAFLGSSVARGVVLLGGHPRNWGYRSGSVDCPLQLRGGTGSESVDVVGGPIAHSLRRSQPEPLQELTQPHGCRRSASSSRARACATTSVARATVLRWSAVVRLMYAPHSFREARCSSRRFMRGRVVSVAIGGSSHDSVPLESPISARADVRE